MTKAFTTIFFLLLLQTVSAKQVITVSAGTNLETIRDQVRSMNGNMSEDIVVELAGGTYFLDSTLVFNAQDSATNGHRIIWKNRANERPVISGGVELKNWQDEGNGIISASVPVGFIFRQLYVNNKKAKRAKFLDGEGKWARVKYNPGKYFYMSVADAQALGIKNWNQIGNVEVDVVSTFVGHQVKLDSITTDSTSTYLHVAEPAASLLIEVVPHFVKEGNKIFPYDIFFENAYEFIDEPGEWYLDETSNKVYYKVKSGESASNVSVIAPSIERLVEINGSGNLVFYGLSFEHSTWLFPSEGGLVTLQNMVREQTTDGTKSSHPISGAIYIRNSHTILLERNIIRFTGGTGIEVYDDKVKSLAMVGNLFYKTAAAAVQYGDNKKKGPITPEEGLYQGYVSNNYFYRCGIEYHSPVFFGTFPYQAEISHNEWLFGNAMGINLGWGSLSTNDLLYRPLVEYNKFDSLARIGSDVSVMHTRNHSSGSRYFENWFDHSIKSVTGRITGRYNDIYNDPKFGNMYLDNDSKDNNFIGNVATNLSSTGYEGPRDGHYVIGKPSSPNYIISYADAAEKKRVKNNAGLLEEYQDIKEYLYTGSIGGKKNPIEHPYASYIHDDRDEEVIYTGNWLLENSVGKNQSNGAYLSTYSTTTTSGASASITFTGLGVRIIGPEYNSGAKIEIYIDNELDSTVTISGSGLLQKTLYKKTGLEYGKHTVKIVKKGSGKFSLDGLIINRNNLVKEDIAVPMKSEGVNKITGSLSTYLVNGFLNIHSTTSMNKVEVYNLKGQRVLEKRVGTKAVRLDVGSLSSGSYILLVRSGKHTEVQKFITVSSGK